MKDKLIIELIIVLKRLLLRALVAKKDPAPVSVENPVNNNVVTPSAQ